MNWDPTTHYQNTNVAESYDDERFARLTGRIYNRWEKAVIRQAFDDLPRDTVVLDLPCGTGRLAEALLDAGLTVVGADISPQMLEVAKRRLSRFPNRFSTRVVDARQVGSEGKQYDAALCARVLMHFPLDEQIAFLRGVASATKGNVVITQSIDTPYQRFRRAVKKAIGNPPSVDYPVTEEELSKLLAGAGLREVRRLRLNSLISEEIIVVARSVESA